MQRLADDPQVVALPIAADGTVERAPISAATASSPLSRRSTPTSCWRCSRTLRDHLAEVIFTVDPDSTVAAAEQDAPMVVLERGWLGQDFVFEVPELVAAVTLRGGRP